MPPGRRPAGGRGLSGGSGSGPFLIGSNDREEYLASGWPRKSAEHVPPGPPKKYQTEWNLIEVDWLVRVPRMKKGNLIASRQLQGRLDPPPKKVRWGGWTLALRKALHWTKPFHRRRLCSWVAVNETTAYRGRPWDPDRRKKGTNVTLRECRTCYIGLGC